MIIDSQNEFSDAQAVTATAISTNVIDLLPGGENTTVDIGAGEDIMLVIKVPVTVTADGDATVTFSLESDSTANLATSATVHWTSAAIGKADLTGGTQVVALALPRGTYERYLGVRYTVGTGPLTAGAFDAFLVRSADSRRNYATKSLISN